MVLTGRAHTAILITDKLLNLYVSSQVPSSRCWQMGKLAARHDRAPASMVLSHIHHVGAEHRLYRTKALLSPRKCVQRDGHLAGR